MKYIIATVRILFLALFLFLVAKGKMMLWLALFGVSLIAAVIFGRVYCGYVCPMNTVMVPAEWISKKLHWIQTGPQVALQRKIWMVCIGCKHGSNVVC